MKRIALALSLALIGCGRPPREAPPDLPIAYPRATITEPRLAEAAAQFVAWARQQRHADQPVYQRIETLPPVDTLLPYGIGTYEKQRRLPLLLTTGPGWQTLTPEKREAELAGAFREAASRLQGFDVKPTLTLQTPQGIELAWVNEVVSGRNLLHGDD